jgi:membrane-associated HD superfamily phosphohydrolase
MTDAQKQELDALLSRLSATAGGALELLREFDTEIETRLEEARQSLQEQIGSVLQAAAPQAAALTQQCHALEARTQAIVAQLDEAGNEVDVALQTMETDLGGWEETRDNAKQAVDDTLTGASVSVDDLVEVMEEALESTVARFEEFQQQITEHIAEKVLSPITEMQDECVERIEKLIEEIVEKILPDKAEQVTGEWISELNEEINVMMDHLQTGLDDFRDTIINGSDAAQSSRQTSEQALDLLRTAFAPVLNELDRVRGLSGTVGISI